MEDTWFAEPNPTCNPNFEVVAAGYLAKYHAKERIRISMDVRKAFPSVFLPLLYHWITTDPLLDEIAREEYGLLVREMANIRIECDGIPGEKCYGLPLGSESSPDLWNYFLGRATEHLWTTFPEVQYEFFADNGSFQMTAEVALQFLPAFNSALRAAFLDIKMADFMVTSLEREDLDQEGNPKRERTLGLLTVSTDMGIIPDILSIANKLSKLHCKKVRCPPYMGIRYLKTYLLPVIRFYVNTVFATKLVSMEFLKWVRDKISNLIQEATCVLNYSLLRKIIMGCDVINLIPPWADPYLKKVAYEILWPEGDANLDPIQCAFNLINIKPLYRLWMEKDHHFTTYLAMWIGAGASLVEDQNNYQKLKILWELTPQIILSDFSITDLSLALEGKKEIPQKCLVKWWSREIASKLKHNLRIIDELFTTITQGANDLIEASQNKYFERTLV
jgi:hypothetical protein